MRNNFIKAFTLVTSYLFLFSFAVIAGNKEITVEWIYSEEGQQITALPSFEWLNDGTLLLFDTGIPEAERTIERLNPRTGIRTPALDRT